jgi:hypothetical protein
MMSFTDLSLLRMAGPSCIVQLQKVVNGVGQGRSGAEMTVKITGRRLIIVQMSKSAQKIIENSTEFAGMGAKQFGAQALSCFEKTASERAVT